VAAAETARLIAELTLKDKFSASVKSATASLGKLETSVGRIGGIAGQGVRTAAGNIAKIGAIAVAGLSLAVKTGLDDLAQLETAVTSVDGAIKQLGDLRGKMMIFEDPGSTSGYLLPKLFLARNGYKLVEKKGFDPNAAPADIQYSFAYLRSKLIEAVLSKQMAAGAISDDDYNGLDEKRKSEVAILAHTEKLPRHLLSVRADLAPQIVGQLNDLLVAMHDDAEGQRILKKTDQTTKFDPLPGGEAALRKRLLDSFFAPERK